MCSWFMGQGAPPGDPDIAQMQERLELEQKVNIMGSVMFAELSITSNFSFLMGASHPEEYMTVPHGWA